MIEQIGRQNGISKSVEALADAGHIGEWQRKKIFAVIDTGIDAIHSGVVPSADDFISVLNLTGNFIESIYVDDDRIE